MPGMCWATRGNGGYRIGIHMKSFEGREPVIIIGGRVRDYCGEYLAGGKIVVLGLDLPETEPIVGRYTATGMHGGAMYIRGEVAEDRIRKGVSLAQVGDDERPSLRELLNPYCDVFGLSVDEVLSAPFTRITAHTTRPYGQLYAY
jgi:glutamate synthase domain-containing protein 3